MTWDKNSQESFNDFWKMCNDKRPVRKMWLLYLYGRDEEGLYEELLLCTDVYHKYLEVVEDLTDKGVKPESLMKYIRPSNWIRPREFFRFPIWKGEEPWVKPDAELHNA